MLSDDVRARVVRKVKEITAISRRSKEDGYNMKSMSLPTFDSQEDFDRCRPDEKGTDFRRHNEFIAEVLKGLVANGIPAEPVLFHFADFSKWLNGKPITPESRSAYGAYLLAVADGMKNEDKTAN